MRGGFYYWVTDTCKELAPGGWAGSRSSCTGPTDLHTTLYTPARSWPFPLPPQNSQPASQTLPLLRFSLGTRRQRLAWQIVCPTLAKPPSKRDIPPGCQVLFCTQFWEEKRKAAHRPDLFWVEPGAVLTIAEFLTLWAFCSLGKLNKPHAVPSRRCPWKLPGVDSCSSSSLLLWVLVSPEALSPQWKVHPGCRG